MDFSLPPELAAYLDELDAFIEAQIKPLENQDVATAIQAGEARLGKTGRLLIRKSGTEPLIRVMGECDDEKLIKTVVGDIVRVIEKACAA